MRARTILIITLILIVLFALAPFIIGVLGQTIAESIGCKVDLNRAIPCVVNGKDWGGLFYQMGFATWYFVLTIPIGGVLFVIWLVPATIVFLASLRRRGTRSHVGIGR
jgi:hypothetical protein